jgi:hypothetical protein
VRPSGSARTGPSSRYPAGVDGAASYRNQHRCPAGCARRPGGPRSTADADPRVCWTFTSPGPAHLQWGACGADRSRVNLHAEPAAAHPNNPSHPYAHPKPHPRPYSHAAADSHSDAGTRPDAHSRADTFAYPRAYPYSYAPAHSHSPAPALARPYSCTNTGVSGPRLQRRAGGH